MCCAVQNLCINEEVRRLGSIQRINDRCMEMQKNKHGETLSHIADPTGGHLWLASTLPLSHPTEKQHQEDGAKRKRGPAKSVCPYNKALALQHMRDEILGAVQDIEQLLKLGRETRSCPYYSTRLAIPSAQVRTSSLAPLSYCAAQSSRDLRRFEMVIDHLRRTYCNCLFGVHSWWCCLIRCCFTMRPEEQQGCS